MNIYHNIHVYYNITSNENPPLKNAPMVRQICCKSVGRDKEHMSLKLNYKIITSRKFPRKIANSSAPQIQIPEIFEFSASQTER